MNSAAHGTMSTVSAYSRTERASSKLEAQTRPSICGSRSGMRVATELGDLEPHLDNLKWPRPTSQTLEATGYWGRQSPWSIICTSTRKHSSNHAPTRAANSDLVTLCNKA